METETEHILAKRISDRNNDLNQLAFRLAARGAWEQPAEMPVEQESAVEHNEMLTRWPNSRE